MRISDWSSDVCSSDLDGYGRLWAQMLAELPAGHPLPVACEAALAPVSVDELSICETMRGEYSSSAAAIDAIDDPKLAGTMQAALNRLVYDPEKTRALIAGNFDRHAAVRRGRCLPRTSD